MLDKCGCLRDQTNHWWKGLFFRVRVTENHRSSQSHLGWGRFRNLFFYLFVNVNCWITNRLLAQHSDQESYSSWKWCCNALVRFRHFCLMSYFQECSQNTHRNMEKFRDRKAPLNQVVWALSHGSKKVFKIPESVNPEYSEFLNRARSCGTLSVVSRDGGSEHSVLSRYGESL